MKKHYFYICSFIALVLAFGLGACERQTSSGGTTSGGNTAAAGNSGSLTIEYETLPSILLEAESGRITAPVALYDDSEASDGKYALAPEGPDHKEISIGGDVTYSITAPKDGEYILWLRAHWAGACGDSLGVLLDGQDLGTVSDSVNEKWHWVRLNRKVLPLTTDTHTLTILNREDGSAWDQILLTQDKDYRPMGIEAADVEGRVMPKNTLPAENPTPVTDAPPTEETAQTPVEN